MNPPRTSGRLAAAALAASGLASAALLHAAATAEAAGAPPATPSAAPAAPATAPPATALPADAAATGDYTSFTLGQIFGSQLQQAGFHGHVDLDALLRGIRAGLDGKAPSNEDRGRIAQVLRGNREALAQENRTRAHAFLATNAGVKGVQTTPSGLQYEVLLAGDAQAASPGPSDRVTVRYRGRLLDGTQFDSSDQHGLSTSFTLDSVIRGWREALMLMKPGASWRLYVPPQLAYDANPPGAIPPGSLLIFDIELLRVDPPPAIGAPPGARPALPPARTTSQPAPGRPAAARAAVAPQ